MSEDLKPITPITQYLRHLTGCDFFKSGACVCGMLKAEAAICDLIQEYRKCLKAMPILNALLVAIAYGGYHKLLEWAKEWNVTIPHPMPIQALRAHCCKAAIAKYSGWSL